MIDGIINTLNLTLETTGRIDKRYCLTEQRTSTGENATTVPYAIEPNGQLKAVDYGKPSLSWWRITSPFSIEEVSTTSAVNKKQATYSLRLVVMYMRKESTADNGFTPAWLAEDLGSVLTQSNGDLKTVLKASDVRVNVTSTDINTTRVWNDEFKDLEFKDPKYVTCLIAFELSVTVIARPDCWQTECEYDTDILHVFDFCKTGTFNRLTDAQKECLTTALCGVCADATVHNSDSSYSTTVASGGDLPLPDNVITLKDTAANILSTTNVPATNAADIEAADSTNEVNGVDISDPTLAEGTHNQLITDTLGNPVGTNANPSVVAKSAISVNSVNVDSVEAEQPYDLRVKDTLGNNIGTSANPSVVSDSTIQNNATPTWTDTVEAEGTLTLAQAKALDSDGATTLLADYIPAADGFMFTCTPGSSASLSVGASDTTPDFGDTITITGTPTGVTPTSYTYILPDGTRVTQAGNTYNWTVNESGSQSVIVTATDGLVIVSSSTVLTIATIYAKHGIAHAWNGEDVTLVSGLVNSANDVVGGINATATSAITRPRFYKDPRSSNNGSFRSITNDYLATTLSTLQNNITIAGVYNWTEAGDSFGGSYMVLIGGTQPAIDAGSRFNLGYLVSSGMHRFNVRTSAGGVGANVQAAPVDGKNVFVLTYDHATGALRLNFNGVTSTATFSGIIFNSASNFTLLNGDGSLNYSNGWCEPTSEIMIATSTLSITNADQLYADLLLKYPS
jgi:hypothetical protein